MDQTNLGNHFTLVGHPTVDALNRLTKPLKGLAFSANIAAIFTTVSTSKTLQYSNDYWITNLPRSSPLLRLFNLLAFVSLITGSAAAIPKEKMISSESLATCMENSQFTVSQFDVTYTPNNSSLQYSFDGTSSIEGNVFIVMDIIVYGYNAYSKTIDPCAEKFASLCPMRAGPVSLPPAAINASAFAGNIPGVAFTIPDIDGVARITIDLADGKNTPVACLEAELSNGQTVHQNAVSWVTAVIAGSGLAASAITSGLGHSNTAAHVAANALSLFGYFQSQAICAMVAVKLPPVVRAWTQNFVWSMGIIRIGFMQNVLHWYIQATGGSPDLLFQNLDRVNVQIMKRGLELKTRALNAVGSVDLTSYIRPALKSLKARSLDVLEGTDFKGLKKLQPLLKRATDQGTYTQGEFIDVTGISRVSFLSRIEETNLFMTGLGFFISFIVLVVIIVVGFKFGLELCVKKLRIAKGSKFAEFRKGWKIVLKGILYRIVLIGFPQLSILCLWELTVRDSPAAMVLAIIFFLITLALLSWASYKVIRLAQHSINMHKSPVVILYSDPASLNRWGFLYVQFKGSCYYWIIPMLAYILVKGIFLAFAQSKGAVQSVALVLIEGVYLVAVSYMRPWMDRKVNVFNISICVINFVNAIFLMVFSGIFHEPDLVRGVMGVVFFVMNAIFALVLLILVLVATVYALISKNPDTRYQPMRDDRASFIKSNPEMVGSTELDALGATARGEHKSSTRDLDEDDSSANHSRRSGEYAAGVPLPSSQAPSQYAPSHYAGSTNDENYEKRYHSPTPYQQQSDRPFLHATSPTRPSPSPTRPPQGFGDFPSYGGGYNQNQGNQRWQVGAGYDH
ncbi:hypothetical protein Dda_7721 [Drechslerella dactyloides]|uniref:ML-like domain-containing protein n=1 Tax=Drechslerella dactyloides TaxID=74499 RepID=A0AAD6IT71_DREDA|nr:hypothetical protein Dda_7721 [Drechslerella dactyloides]